MNKKILIASIFATLMLLVPMTSVVGVSDVEEDCGCEVVNRYDLFRVKLLIVRLKVITNILLLRFGHIPEIQEKCQEILDVINSNRLLDYPIICAILEPIYNQIRDIGGYLEYLRGKYEDNEIILRILFYIGLLTMPIASYIVWAGIAFDCDWLPEP